MGELKRPRDALVDENVNLARRANLLGRVDDAGDLVCLAHIGLHDDGLGAVGLDLLRHLLGTLAAAGRDVVDDDVGSPLPEEDGDAGTDAPVLSAVSDAPARGVGPVGLRF